jgi:hypothetical protein
MNVGGWNGYIVVNFYFVSFGYRMSFKFIINIISFVIFIYFLTFSFSFAKEQPEICSSTPDYIENLKNFSNDIFDILNWSSRKDNSSEWWDSENSNWMIDDIRHSVKQQVSSLKDKWKCPGLYINDLLMNSLSLPFALFVLLRQPEAVVRDYENLWDLSNNVRDNFLKICFKWFSYEELNSSEKQRLKQSIENYLNSNPLIKFKFNDKQKGLKYSTVYSFLYKLVNSHRELLLKLSHNDFSWNVADIKLDKLFACPKWKNNVVNWCLYFTDIKLNRDLVAKLMKDYRKCSFINIDILKELKNLDIKFWKKISKDIDRIKKAYKRLKETLTRIHDWLTDYEAELATNYRWRSFKKWEWSINPLEGKRLVFNIENNLQKERNEFIEPFKNLFWDQIVTYGKCYWNKETWKVTCIWRDFSFNNFQKLYEENFLKIINWTFYKIKSYQDLLVNEEVEMDPTPLTRLFPILTWKVDQAIALIWSRYKAGTLIRTLWKSCENQCSNLWWICWYY